MAMSSPAIEYQSDDPAKSAIIVVDSEVLFQDCLVEAMRGAFPQAIILGTSTIAELAHLSERPVALVIFKVKPHPIFRERMAFDIRAIMECLPDTPIVAIANCDDAADIEIAIAAGAQGVIPITASLKIAVAALQLVLAGGNYFPRQTSDSVQVREGGAKVPYLAAELPRALASPERLAHPSRDLNGVEAVSATQAVRGETNGLAATFTAREAEVLAALQKGYSNKWIAHHLNLSENTVKAHIRHIMRKLHATNRTEAVILSQHLLPIINGY